MNNNKPPLLILLPVILIGLIMLVFGIYNIYTVNLNTKDYIAVNGKFVGSSISSSNSDGTTNKLTYLYVVNNKGYYISTAYETASVPNIGDIRTVKYDPTSPEKAVLTGFNENHLLVYIGTLFFLVPLIMIFNSAILISVLFIFIGGGTYYLMCSSTDSLSLIDAFKINGLWIVIPIIFVVIGVWNLIWMLFRKKNKYVVAKVDKIEHIGMEGKFRVLLSDEKIAEGSIIAITCKYYIYETLNENKFSENKSYKFDLYKYGVMLACEPISDVIQARVLNSFNDDDFIEEI